MSRNTEHTSNAFEYPGVDNFQIIIPPAAKQFSGVGCFPTFGISLTLTGFLVSIGCGFYFLLNHGPYHDIIICTFSALFCFFVCLHLLERFVIHKKQEPVLPFQMTTTDNLRTLIRSQSEGVTLNIAGRSQSTLSLPAYIVIPTEHGEREKLSTALTDSFQNAGSFPKKLDEASGSATLPSSQKLPVSSELSSTSKLKEAFTAVCDVIESISTETDKSTIEISSESSSKEMDAETVRQRKPSPMEPQEYVPLPEVEKTE